MADMSETKAAPTLASIPGLFAEPAAELVSKLPKPTKRDNPKGRCNDCGGYHGLPAVHLDYVGHGDLTMMLLAIDPTWGWEPVAFDKNGAPLITERDGTLELWGYLTVLGQRRFGVGTCEKGKPEAAKELIGDLLRNAAMRFGFCTKMWSKTAGLPSLEDHPAPRPVAQHAERTVSSTATSNPQTSSTRPANGGTRREWPVVPAGRHKGVAIDKLTTSELKSTHEYYAGRLPEARGKRWYDDNLAFVDACASLLRLKGAAAPAKEEREPGADDAEYDGHGPDIPDEAEF